MPYTSVRPLSTVSRGPWRRCGLAELGRGPNLIWAQGEPLAAMGLEAHRGPRQRADLGG